MEERFSLIWSAQDRRRPFASMGFADDLKLTDIFNVNLFSSPTDRLELGDFFTADMDTVKLRNELFSDLMQNRDMIEPLKELTRDLYDLRRINMVTYEVRSSESELFRIKEIAMYTELINKLYGLLDGRDLKSCSLREFYVRISEIYHGEDFIKLCAESERLGSSINNIKSITIGINLDAQLMPVEAGLLGVNGERFVSGNIIDKLLRMDIKGSEYECLAPLEVLSRNLKQKEQDALSVALNNGLYTVFSRSVSGWKSVIRKYTGERTEWLCGLIPELAFIIGCVSPLISLSDRGYPLCMPEMGDEESVVELYDPLFTAFNTEEATVKNGITFDSEGRIHILTGPNQGGKSVFIRSVGYLYAMLHLGLPLPARSARVCPVDGIFTHFPSKSAESYGKGRFASECSAIADINARLTESSLFLYDESFSGTGNMEAVTVATEIISAYASIGCKGVFATHLHDLCSMADEINAQEDIISRVDNLSARLDPKTNQRTYTVEKGASYGKSFAYDIAKKYKLTRSDILNGIRS